MSETLFIADLHLSGERPETTRLFLQLMEGPARSVDALYILGDLFEIWFGDDDPAAEAREIVAALRRLSSGGTPLHFMRGNRDFLVGERFAEEAGATLLDDPTVIELYGTPTLLMHGDTLCSEDLDYQQFRAQVRDPAWIERTLALPVAERKAMIAEIRRQSMAAMQEKREVIMDVEQATVEMAMHEHGVYRLIHGHTHRPGIHHFELDGREARRMVVGDWHPGGSVLFCGPDGCRLEPFTGERG